MAPRVQIDPEKLRAARQKAGNGSMTAAAAAAGLSWMGYRKWEREGPRRKFDYNAFMALCDYLEVEPEDITEEVPPVLTPQPDEAPL